MRTNSQAQTLDGEVLTGRRVSFSSQVVPGLIAAFDSVVILTVAVLSFLFLVGDHAEDASYYTVAVSFVWIVTLLLMNFAGLYQLEPILRPLKFSDKILVSFA